MRMYPEGTGPFHGCIPKGIELKEFYKFPRFFQANAFLGMLQRTTFIHTIVLEEQDVFVVGSGVQEKFFFGHGKKGTRIIAHYIGEGNVSDRGKKIGHEDHRFSHVRNMRNHHAVGMSVYE